jgi:signal transduction histidine kinase/CheY-like chemotaxis protein
MSLWITYVSIAFMVALAVFLGIALIRAHVTIAELRDALAVASEAQRTKDSLLSQRSELDTIKDEFISTVSHELRTPLTSIRGALGLLSSGVMGNVDAKAQNLIRIAVTNTDRLIRLINDILDLERMQSGRAPLQVRRCSMRELAQQAVETMTPMADSAGVRLTLQLTAAPDAVFFDGDPDRILQVLTNLLSNAIKFSPSPSTVRISIGGDDQAVVLRVSDEGRGIPVDKLDSIFDRFQQVEASDARQKGGTGLGLAICRTIVQQHNGSIWAESHNQNHPGAGASLIVSLPRVSRSDDTSAQARAVHAERISVILCDDDPGVRTVVAEHLRQHGYEILEAATGEEAIRLAESANPEAILLDLYLPGMTGWETLQRLKSSPRTSQIPVVILSVLSPTGSSAPLPSIASDAQGWVQKPFNERFLLAELSRVLQSDGGKIQVLLVEDDNDLADVVSTGFEQANVGIVHARTRQAAMDHCLFARPDLLILDLTLPDGDGFSLVEWLRKQPTLRALPLVVYSGLDLSDEERAQLRLGPTEFLTKAKVQPSEVEALVLSIVQKLRVIPPIQATGSSTRTAVETGPPSHTNTSETS